MHISNWEDGVSACSLSEAEEKTIKAFCEQVKVSSCLEHIVVLFISLLIIALFLTLFRKYVFGACQIEISVAFLAREYIRCSSTIGSLVYLSYQNFHRFVLSVELVLLLIVLFIPIQTALKLSEELFLPAFGISIAKLKKMEG